MDPYAYKRLLEVNRQFYQSFAHPFAETRKRPQPGVFRIIERLSPSARILDLGCGSGVLWQSLVKRGFRGTYLGLDFSKELLQIAIGDKLHQKSSLSLSPGGEEVLDFNRSIPQMPESTFLQADLASPDWDISLKSASFDVILAFAVLHHLPGIQLRIQVLHKVHRLLTLTGQFIHSVWQFLNSPRLSARIQPWESIGLTLKQLDHNDYLLDWRHGGSAMRYVHHFDHRELASLANQSKFYVAETFLSDGESGNLGLYQVWQKQSQ